MTNILISIKPQYSQQIFAGKKTIELRKKFPLLVNNSTVYVYESAPTQAIVGKFKIKKQESFMPTQLSLSDFWEKHNDKLGITEKDFYAYYKEAKQLNALFIDQFVIFEKQTLITTMRNLLSINPPQSFCYADKIDKYLAN